MNPSEEREWTRAAAGGDRKAFDRLGAAYIPRLHRFITLMGIDEADDVLQETLHEAFSCLSKFRGESPLSSWLIGIAVNRCRRWWKGRAGRAAPAEPAALDGPDRRAPDRSVPSGLVRRESAERVSLALEGLPPILREAFVLKHVEDLDYREIGLLTGTTEGTARVRAHRAKLLLQEELGPAFRTLLEQYRK